MRIAIALLLLCAPDTVDAQTWAELHTVPRETSVRIFEAAGKGWTFADGKLLLVKDEELTILRRSGPVVIPKGVISKVETRRRDRPIEGAIIGALVNVALGALGGWQGCSDSKCAVVGIPVYAAVGAIIDWRIPTRRTVYRAP